MDTTCGPPLRGTDSCDSPSALPFACRHLLISLCILLQGTYQIFVLFLIVYGAPARLSKFALPSACMAFSNVDAHTLDVGLVNQGAVAGSLYNPAAPSPRNFEPKRASCQRGPCLDMCCNRNVTSGFCLDNLVSQGGHYGPGAVSFSA